MHDDPFHDLRKQSSGRTIFDYDIESDLYACFLRWFLTRFVWWFFGPLALFGILVYLYALCFYQPPSGLERARMEQEKTEKTSRKCENYFKY